MNSRYHELLVQLRKAFPQPVSDPVHDAYFVLSLSRALDKVDDMKGQAPLLGRPTEIHWEEAQNGEVAETGRTLEQVIPQIVSYLEGMFVWGHPRSQINVISHPSIASIIGVLLPSTYNPNLCSEESSRRLAEVEIIVNSMIARLIGYDPRHAGGVFTFGGTGGLLYGVKMGIEKAFPGALRKGLREPAYILASDCSHYACLNVAGWLGLGQEQVVLVPSHDDNSIQLPELEKQARRILSDGGRIACFVATMGSTDAFGIDDLAGVVKLRDALVAEFQLDYVPHVHADAVIGWAWSVFNDYDFLRNELQFRGRTTRALAAANYRIRWLHLADSLGIDFHKTGYCPYISSLFCVKNRNDFALVTRPREAMPYLYQSGDYHPGMFTLETSRSATGPLAALANLLLFGKQGLRALLGHVVEMAEVLRETIESHPDTCVMNGDNVGPVTLFRVYPSGVDTFQIKRREKEEGAFRDQLLAYNRYNRRVFEKINDEALSGNGVVLSMTDCYRESDEGVPIAALKSYVLSPFSEESQMRSILDHVLRARDQVDAELATPSR